MKKIKYTAILIILLILGNFFRLFIEEKNIPKVEIKSKTVWERVKLIMKFIWRYTVNFWYGLKGRFISLFNFEIGLISFVKALFKLPFESWYFAKMDLINEGLL